MLEEFEEEVSIGRLTAVIEAVFGTTHEIDLCFDAELAAQTPFHDISEEHAGDEAGIPLVFQWIPVADVYDERILPRPVADAITSRSGRCDYWFDDERLAPLTS